MNQRPENPFSSRFTKPGVLPFLTPAGFANPQLELSHLLAHLGYVLETARPRLAIIGPHGTGKTTLIRCVQAGLSQHFKGQIVETTLRLGQKQVDLWSKVKTLDATSLLIVDGYEQLGWLGRTRLSLSQRSRSFGLLVTSHQPPVGFSVIATTKPDKQVAKRLTEFLLRDIKDSRFLPENEFQRCWQDSKGNMRTLWAKLYDWFELQLQVVAKE